MDGIKWVLNEMPKSDGASDVMALPTIRRVRAFHRGFPEYAPTPLAHLDKLASRLGLGGVYVKDESKRFGLNAFKVLGGTYAVGRTLANRLGMEIEEADYATLTSDEAKRRLGEPITFFTATDGNHGRGVAWAARRLGQHARIYMPEGTRRVRFENIRKENAVVTIEPCNFDACVRMAAEDSAKVAGSVIVQDTAWAGYTDMTRWIMQGYGTLVLEIAEQIPEPPTHVFAQAGVGSMAGAVVGCLRNLYPDNPPVAVVVEPHAAACHYESAKAGGIRFVTGELNTIMAGLACGEPNIVSWDILKNDCAAFLSIPDSVAAKGMRTLGAPIGDDPRVISGESGAATLGALATVMEREEYAPLRDALHLDGGARVLLISTEGDTDPERYREIVWDGALQSI